MFGLGPRPRGSDPRVAEPAGRAQVPTTKTKAEGGYAAHRMSSVTPFRAVPWMAGTLICFSLVGVATRELTVGAGLDIFQVILLRIAIGLAIIAPFVLRGGWASIRTKNLRLHALRNFFFLARLTLGITESLFCHSPMCLHWNSPRRFGLQFWRWFF